MYLDIPNVSGVADKFGVSRDAIYYAQGDKGWRHVKAPEASTW